MAYAVIHLLWFLGDSYEREDKIIQNLLLKSEIRMKKAGNITDKKIRTLKNIHVRNYKSNDGIKFYTFTDDGKSDINKDNKILSNGNCA